MPVQNLSVTECSTKVNVKNIETKWASNRNSCTSTYVPGAFASVYGKLDTVPDAVKLPASLMARV